MIMYSLKRFNIIVFLNRIGDWVKECRPLKVFLMGVEVDIILMYLPIDAPNKALPGLLLIPLRYASLMSC
jgi:hypothetical protein